MYTLNTKIKCYSTRHRVLAHYAHYCKHTEDTVQGILVYEGST